MKKVMSAVLMLLCLFGLTACAGQQEMSVMGLRAKVISVQPEAYTVVVEFEDMSGRKDINDFKWKSLEGIPVTLECKDIPIIYCNDQTQELKSISVSELMEGDELLLKAELSELKKAKDGPAHVQQIQLSTQRM